MKNFVDEVLQNSVLLVSICAWLIAQTLKVILTLLLNRRLDIRRFVGSGGMPSAHSAFVVSMATSIGQVYGYNSSMFALSTAFALVVMYDAAGVRRAAGRQAVVLNEIVDILQTKRKISERKLKELIGHTPVEVIVGALLGIMVSKMLLGYFLILQ
ncbi:MAG TPA: divergent PAP2 family protein [Clostridiales bacterium]|nr:divergent PAP2 family protein [Clostridiales bacterium]